MALQMSGLSRDVGIWIWAAGTVIQIGLIFGPPLAKLMGGRRALVFGAILLGFGAAMYLYIVYIVLNYAMARYQSPTRGQFISENPVLVDDPSQQNLNDPQNLNSYSSGRPKSPLPATGER